MDRAEARRRPVWIGALIIGVIFFALAYGNTITSWGISDVIYESGAMGVLVIVPAILGFSLQILFLRKRAEKFAVWIPLLLSAVCLAVSEALYMSGDFGGMIVGAAVWYVAFFGFCGIALAILLDIVLRQKRGVRIAAGCVALTLTILAAWFWPKNLGGKIDIDPGNEYIWYFKGEAPENMTVRGELKELIFYLNYLKVMPAYSGPDELYYGSKLLRINDEYILVAKDRGCSYIYQYSGDMDAFDGNGLKWRTSSESAIYTSIY